MTHLLPTGHFHAQDTNLHVQPWLTFKHHFPASSNCRSLGSFTFSQRSHVCSPTFRFHKPSQAGMGKGCCPHLLGIQPQAWRFASRIPPAPRGAQPRTAAPRWVTRSLQSPPHPCEVNFLNHMSHCKPFPRLLEPRDFFPHLWMSAVPLAAVCRLPPAGFVTCHPCPHKSPLSRTAWGSLCALHICAGSSRCRGALPCLELGFRPGAGPSL